MIYTSNYFNVWGRKNIVQISNGCPKNLKVDDQFPRLYPKWVWVKAKYPWDVFAKKYKLLLSELNVHTIARAMDGKILCCYEDLSKGHCHRELVREWFIENGYECEELPSKKAKKSETKKKATKKVEQDTLL